MDNNLEGMEFKLDSKDLRGTLNSEILYTITLKNSLDRDVFDLTIPIKIPNHTKYKENSLNINGINYTLNESNSFRIPQFPQDSIISLTYIVIVLEIPLSGIVENEAIITYIDKITGEEVKSQKSNKVVCKIKGIVFKVEGFLSNKSPSILDEINYEVNIVNIGNIRALNVEIQELVPKAIKIKSMVLNGNEILKRNFYDSVPVGNIEPGKFLTLKWTGIVTDITKGTEEIKSRVTHSFYDDNLNETLLGDVFYDTKSFEVAEGYFKEYMDFSKSLTLNKLYPLIHEDCDIKFIVENKGNVNCEKILFKLNFSEGVLFSHCKINGQFIKASELANEVNIKDILPNERFIFEGKMKINSFIPVNKNISAFLKYESYNSLTGEYINKKYESNQLLLQSYGAVLQKENGQIKKECSKASCNFGDIVDYRIVLKNDGNTKYSKISFKEEESNNLKFIEGSFKVNNTILNLNEINSGIYLGELYPQNSIEITYQMKVINENICDWLVSKSIITCEQFRKNGEVIAETFASIFDKTRIIYGMLEEKNCHEEVIKCKKSCENIYTAEIENIGNIPLNDVKIDIKKSSPINFTKINIIKSNDEIEEVQEDDITISSIFPGEKLKVEGIFKIGNESDDKIEIYGDVVYFYNSTGECAKQKGSLKITPKIYEITNGDLSVDLDLINDIFFKDESLSGSIVVRNVGNVDIFNICIEVDKENTLHLKRLNGAIFENKMYIDYLSIGEKKLIPIILTPAENNINKIFTFKGTIQGYYSSIEGEEITKKSFAPLEKEILSENMILQLSSDKLSYFVDEVCTFTLISENMGSHTLEEPFLKLNIPSEIDIIDDIIHINYIPYKYSNICNGVILDSIPSGEVTTIKYKGKLNTRNSKSELNTNFVISGYYKIRETKLIKKYISTNLINNIDEISVKCFLNSNKTLLLTNESIRYNATLINDGTVPVNLKLSFDCGELQEVTNIVDNIPEEELIYITPNDGAIIEKELVYKGFKGSNLAIIKGVIDVYYSGEKSLCPIYKQFETDALEIELTNTTFKEILITDEVDITNTTPKIFEICKVYVKPSILNYKIRCIKRNYDFDAVDVEGYKVDIVGQVLYSVEYLTNCINDGINLLTFEKIFTSNIVLPDDFVYGEDVDISQKILDTTYKIVDGKKLFINISILINTSM